MSPLRALLRKDLPWLLFFLVGGTVGLVLALCSRSFGFAFVVSPGRREELFHVAWSCGMGLGVVAFAFDELLGTRDYLAQRRVTVGDLMRARLVGCALVIASWMLLAPVLAYLLLWFDSGPWQWGHWQQLPAIWGTMVPAWSACALAVLAVSLPFVWWLRLLCLGAMFVVSFSAIFWCERESPWSPTSWSTFVLGHFVVAIGAMTFAFWASTGERDADRPLTPRARRTAVVPMLVVAAAAGTALLWMLEGNAIGRLRSTYPSLCRHDGGYVLAVRPDWRQPWLVVDAQHAPTGERLTSAKGVSPGGSDFGLDLVRIEGPNARSSWQSWLRTGGQLWVGDGVAWWSSSLSRSLQRVLKIGDEPGFAPDLNVHTMAVDGGARQVVVFVERDANVVWLLDESSLAVRPLPLAEGDHANHIARADRLAPLEPDGVAPAVGKEEDVVWGSRYGYALREGRLQPVGKVPQPDPRDDSPWNGMRVTAGDGLGWTVAIDAAGGMPAFHHRFEPRTLPERVWAGVACWFGALRPPLLQLAAACMSPTESPPGKRWFWWLDPLVMHGRRWWLVAAGAALAAWCAWRTRRRLRHLGADAATLRFWTVATLLLGPVGAWCSVLWERPRAWADRSLVIPVAAPRIVSLEPFEENAA